MYEEFGTLPSGMLIIPLCVFVGVSESGPLARGRRHRQGAVWGVKVYVPQVIGNSANLHKHFLLLLEAENTRLYFWKHKYKSKGKNF